MYICLHIRKPTVDDQESKFSHSFRHFQAIRTRHLEDPDNIDTHHYTPCCFYCRGPPLSSLEEFESYCARRRHRYATHPFHRTPYELEVSATKRGRWTAEQEDLYFKWLRGLFNTNPIVRSELTKVFWTRVAIETTDLYSRNVWAIPNVLEDRPSILSRIKYLGMDVNFEGIKLNTHYNFKTLCVLLSKSLRLDRLSLDLTFRQSDINDLMSETVKSEILSATRSLYVAKEFKVTCDKIWPDVWQGEHRDDGSDDEYEQKLYEIEDKLQKECDSILTELMLPDTLRKQPPKNEMEVYLQSRLDD